MMRLYDDSLTKFMQNMRDKVPIILALTLIAKDAPYLSTEDFLDALDRRLQTKMG